MTGTERMTAYLHSLETPQEPILEEIRREALEAKVPVVRSETAGLLRVLVSANRPKRILEIGTAVGYSALVMYYSAERDCHITTIENYDKRIASARENFARARVGDAVTLLCGDAAELLPTLERDYDFIFMDAAKAQYIVWLPELLRLLSPDGMLVSDNVLQDGDVLESRYAVTRRNRTIHARMREYLYALTHNEELYTSVLPLGDGVALTSRRRQSYRQSQEARLDI